MKSRVNIYKFNLNFALVIASISVNYEYLKKYLIVKNWFRNMKITNAESDTERSDDDMTTNIE